MFELMISNQIYPSWNDSARMRVRAVLAFLPADFERVIVTLEYVPKENSEQWQYCCRIRAREVSGRWHTVKAPDFDAHHALEHAIHLVVKSAMECHLDQAVTRQVANHQRFQMGPSASHWNEIGFN